MLRLVRAAVQAGVGKEAIHEVVVPATCPDAAVRGRTKAARDVVDELRLAPGAEGAAAPVPVAG